MKMTAPKIPVDCGSVVAVVTEISHPLAFRIKKGKYELTLSCKECWREGGTKNSGYLDVKKDSYLSVSDCGLLQELKIKDSDLHKKGVLLSTGGDGSFDIEIHLRKVERLGRDPFKKLLGQAKDFFKANDISEYSTGPKFVKLFLENVYYREVNEVIEKERSKEMRDTLKACETFLAKLKKLNKKKA